MYNKIVQSAVFLVFNGCGIGEVHGLCFALDMSINLGGKEILTLKFQS